MQSILRYFNPSINAVRGFYTCCNVKAPNPAHYDNQTFYENVNFGEKHHPGNVRDRHRQTKAMQRKAFQKLTRVRVTDNSALALQSYYRYPRVIQVYHKTGYGRVGDTVLLAIGGLMKRALIIGQKRSMGPMKARMDSNNVILINDDGTPDGTRITVPVPSFLRGIQSAKQRVQISKVIAIAGRFV
uniref:39S ribosomal protein L14, mitochondrial-like n=1 Tax=Styela clava TaxID=7725 RepID=UPI00193ADFA0|nr:39S ribosomal protein L14, mitochondrial-like [Styela clava]XP_039253679.1 39S ribosomal protein L14, mitochondrial-like [Styela clava]